METLKQKYKKLEVAVKLRIRAKLLKKGVKSEHSSETVLKVKDDQSFNLDGGRYLTEISATDLIDNCGYSYDYSCITLEELCEAVDNI